MDNHSYDELVTRLTAEDGPAGEVVDLVLAAAEGPDALNAHLDGGPAPERRSLEPLTNVEPARAYLSEIAVAGFRGVSQRARLPFEAGPGLTLVVGRNGSGKSTFAEGLELLLTGRNLRWDNKPKAWKDGWRNLHADGPTKLEATFQVDGQATPLRVARSWSTGALLDDGGPVTVTGALEAWDALGWDEPLQRYRPLLTYNEIGAMFSERAADLYTALSAVLGLEAFDAMQARLRVARLGRSQSAKDEKKSRKALTETLASAEDDRARQVRGELTKRAPDVDAVKAVLAGRVVVADDTGRLQLLARLAVPSAAEIERVIAEAATARLFLAELEATDAERDAGLADLLDAALRFHADHRTQDETCPVCGTRNVLGPTWSLQTQADVERLRQATADLRKTRAEAAEAQRRVDDLFPATTPTTLRAAGLPVEPALRAWDTWTAARSSRQAALTLRKTLLAACAQADQELADRDATWLPLEAEIVKWLGLAQDAVRDKLAVRWLTAAEEWMKVCTATLRSERLQPIADAAQENWNELRHQSNVALGKVELAQQGLQRMVVFDVTVDGAQSSAFGVMSQGELSALAVSVFLPRAAMPETPFGFMVIDDPVQSMDPAKVDGLARVLGAASMSRQVIVFTHDERLTQAVERLGIPARVMNVKRRAQSQVEVVAGMRPSERYLREAFMLCDTPDLADEIRGRVVPGFCRSAIEAACATRIRRRRLAAGDPHADVETLLTGLTSLTTWLAEAFGLSKSQGQAVTAEVRRLAGEEAVTIVRRSAKGAHERLGDSDAKELTRGAKRLVTKLETA